MAKTALITGASTGIGMEFAGIFAREGYDLVLVARNAEKLNKVADALSAAYRTAITVLPLDLAANGAPEALVEALSAQNVTVDVLVNNAGMGDYGQFIDEEVGKLRAMLRLNVVVPTVLARLIGAGMAERGSGAILNVASIAAFMPGPWMSAYFATKAHVLSLSEGLAYELAPQNVKVTALCPGATKTPFFESAGALRSKLVAGKRLPTAKQVAEYGYRSLMRGKRVAVYGFVNKLLVFSIRFMPRNLIARLVANTQAPQ